MVKQWLGRKFWDEAIFKSLQWYSQYGGAICRHQGQMAYDPLLSNPLVKHVNDGIGDKTSIIFVIFTLFVYHTSSQYSSNSKVKILINFHSNALQNKNKIINISSHHNTHGTSSCRSRSIRPNKKCKWFQSLLWIQLGL